MLLTAAAWLVQVWALYTPGSPGPSQLPLDKAAHVALFASITAAAVWAGLDRRGVVAAMAAQALVSEFVQENFLAYRGAEAGDLVADAFGITVGLWLGAWALQRWPGRPVAGRVQPGIRGD